MSEFVRAVRPRQLWDLGCNDGEFAEVALESGAQAVIGFDADPGALDRAFHRAVNRRLNLLPLYQDAANPSPGQGWLGVERAALDDRGSPDAMLALAFEHHLAVGRNIPLPEVVRRLTAVAPTGVIEFVQKSDPTIQRMLTLRGDIFPDYTEGVFASVLAEQCRIVRAHTISATGRKLFWYER